MKARCVMCVARHAKPQTDFEPSTDRPRRASQEHAENMYFTQLREQVILPQRVDGIIDLSIPVPITASEGTMCVARRVKQEN